MKMARKLLGKNTSLHEKLLAGNKVYEGTRFSPHTKGGGGINFGRPREKKISKGAIQRRFQRTGK